MAAMAAMGELSSVMVSHYSCLSFVTLVITFRIYCQYFVWSECRNKKSLNGKTVVITGSNSGVGKETAKQLVQRGARVVMACRDQKSAEAVMREMREMRSAGEMVYKHMDLSSFASVKRFAEEVMKSEKSIDILINNAAVFGPPFALTVDGFETQFQVNHLSNALLTLLLLPKLQESSHMSDKSRILLITSTLYRKGVIDENDFKKGYASVENYGLRKAYSNSKLANILFARTLHKNIVQQKQSIDVLMASPGIVWTNLSRHLRLKWWQLVLLSPFAVLFVRTPKQGSQTVLHCSTADSLTADRLYRNCSEQKWDSIANDSHLSDKVYDLTLKAIESYLK